MKKLKGLLKEEQPREKLMNSGARTLSDAELLAIILRTGFKEKSVIELSRDLIKNIKSLKALKTITVSELTQFKGIGKVKALELMAVLEIGRRVFLTTEKLTKILTPRDSYLFLKDKFFTESQEQMFALFLDSKSNVLACELIAIGTLNKTLIHPRDILRWALKYSAYGVVISHNHPSGDPTPSKSDLVLTEQVIKACEATGIVFVDHVIIGKNTYYSFLERGKNNGILW